MLEIAFVLRILPIASLAERTNRLIRIGLVVIVVAGRFGIVVVTIAWMGLLGAMHRILPIARCAERTDGPTFATSFR